MRFIAGLAIIAAVALWALPSYALGPCDNFNLLRFDPAELERCINEMSDKIRQQQAEIQLLKTYICSFAVEDWARDKGSLGASIFMDDCPKPRPKKTPQKPPARK